MITREQALKFLDQRIENKNIIKHMLAVEALMGGVYDFLGARGETDLGGSKKEWMMAGLLHDGDYNQVSHQEHGVQVAKWLKKAGFEIPDNVAQTIAAHNWENTGVKPQSKMDWVIFCGDSLTGLIVATALVHPGKKIAKVKVKSVMKKFKDKAFARGTRRKDIALCEEKLSIPLRDFIEISLKAMKEIAGDLGL